MNPDTLVAISCYSGDTFRIENALSVGLLTHHECPIVLLSPADAPGVIPPFLSRSCGVRGTQGQESLDRWDGYFRMLLEFPQNNFLIIDSDSYCLTPELPKRFYDQPGVFWSYHCPEGRPHASPYPKVAFQSPMFLNREIIEKLLSVDRSKVRAHPITPFQDWYLVALACESGVEYKHNPDAISYMGWNGGPEFPTDNFDLDASYLGGDRMVADVLSGKILIHSVRHKYWLERMIEAHQEYLQRRGRSIPC